MAYINFKPQDYFNTLIYTGTGSSHAVTGVGFQPNGLSWFKGRQTGRDHYICDAVRGSTKGIRSAKTDGEGTNTTNITSFDSDGFTIGTDSDGEVNEGGSTENKHVSWHWKAGTTSGLTGGTITPSAYSYNTTSKLSILKYTGTGSNATIAHMLGVKPTTIIIKRLNGLKAWAVWHTGLTSANYHLTLNTTSVEVADSGYWQSTDPTSTVFSIGTNGHVNESGDTYIAYVFSDVKGYSKMGSYIGNGNVDGTFAYTGFRAAWIMIKDTQDAEQGIIFDNKRALGNVAVPAGLFPALNNGEGTSTTRDIQWYANGFKPDGGGGEVNFIGKKYVYWAFAENPLIGSNGTAGVAR